MATTTRSTSSGLSVSNHFNPHVVNRLYPTCPSRLTMQRDPSRPACMKLPGLVAALRDNTASFPFYFGLELSWSCLSLLGSKQQPTVHVHRTLRHGTHDQAQVVPKQAALSRTRRRVMARASCSWDSDICASRHFEVLRVINLPLGSREWRNGSNGSYNCTPFLHSLLTKGK